MNDYMNAYACIILFFSIRDTLCSDQYAYSGSLVFRSLSQFVVIILTRSLSWKESGQKSCDALPLSLIA